MLSLAFDTATRWGRFALAEDGELLVFRPLNVSGSYADALLPVIDEMLDEAGRSRREIGAVGVTCGPGSFTGVRIGVATAKGLAYGLDCELVAVTSLACMAAALLRDNPEADLAVPVLDARRGELFAGVYRRDGAWVDETVAPGAADPDTWWGRVTASVPRLEEVVFGGEGAGLLLGQGPDLRSELRSLGVPALRPWSAAHPATAPALALAMGTPGADLPRTHPFALAPRYMRVSDAEIKKKIDLTPRAPDTSVEGS